MEEAYRSWDREAVLEDMVRVVRLNRPLVVVARFHGSRRDGHGHHHASGLLTPDAVEAAADPGRFPDQIEQEGLRPWRVLRTYRGGIRVDESFHVEVDARGESPWVGTSFQRWASRGLGLQRSQTAGRVRTGGGLYRYELRDGGGGDGGASRDTRGRGDEGLPPSQAEDSFFAGVDTSLNGLPTLLGETASPETGEVLAQLQGLVDELIAGFDFRAPGQSVPNLVRGLGLLRSAIESSTAAPETRFHLRLKERQFEDAIAAAGGLRVEAGPPGGAAGAVVVPGQILAAGIAVEASGAAGVGVSEARIVDRAGAVLGRTSGFARTGNGFAAEAEVRVPETGADAMAAAPYFAREGLARNHYQVADSADLHLPWRRPALSVAVDLVVDGTTMVYTAPLTAPRAPPAVRVGDAPGRGAAGRVGRGGPGGAGGSGGQYGRATRRRTTGRSHPHIRAPHRAGERAAGPLRPHIRPPGHLGEPPDRPHPHPRARYRQHRPPPRHDPPGSPAGWAAAPATVAHDFARTGEVAEVAFEVAPPDGWEGAATIEAVSRAGGREYRTGYQTIDHRDLRLARLWRPATTTVRSVPVARLDGARVGYVMGGRRRGPQRHRGAGCTGRNARRDRPRRPRVAHRTRRHRGRHPGVRRCARTCWSTTSA